jgi:predicted dehydrogenase
MAFYQNVYDAIRHKKNLTVQPEQARDVIKLIEACIESNRNMKAVKI